MARPRKIKQLGVSDQLVEKEPVSRPPYPKLLIWEENGIPCYYVQFQSPCPPSVNKEPVFEFSLKNLSPKYVVERITLTEHGVIWRSNGEMNFSPSANVKYCRAVQ